MNIYIYHYEGKRSSAPGSENLFLSIRSHNLLAIAAPFRFPKGPHASAW